MSYGDWACTSIVPGHLSLPTTPGQSATPLSSSSVLTTWLGVELLALSAPTATLNLVLPSFIRSFIHSFIHSLNMLISVDRPKTPE